nr:CoA transferase [Mycobacterium shigaense]
MGQSHPGPGPIVGDVPGPEGRGLFAYLNTNKQSLEFDVTDPAGTERLHELIGAADAVIDDRATSWAERHHDGVLLGHSVRQGSTDRIRQRPEHQRLSPAAGAITRPAIPTSSFRPCRGPGACPPH